MTNQLFNKFLYVLALILVIKNYACLLDGSGSVSPLEYNLKLAGKNRSELEKVLAHYNQNIADSLKLKSAIFLISNMENNKHFDSEWLDQYDQLFSSKAASLQNEEIPAFRDTILSRIGSPEKKDIQPIQDLQSISAIYLIKNIDDAFVAWQNAPWRDQVNFDTFCNFILPYKVYNESPMEWRGLFSKKYDPDLEHSDPSRTMENIICAQVDQQKTWLLYSDELIDYPGALNGDQILKIKKGDCVEFASLGAQAARALGMPVAIDYVEGHHWNALILPDNKFVSFLGGESRPGDHINIRESDSKFTKVYRRNTNWVPSSFAARAIRANIKSIPEFLENPRILDVTASYTQTSDLKLKIPGKNGSPVYLTVFRKDDFEVISGDFVKNDSVLFRQTAKREVYIPMFFKKGKYKPAGPPIQVPVNENWKELKTTESGYQSMILQRNYPFKKWMERILDEPMIGARIEGANDPDFQKPYLLYEIKKTIKPYQGKLLNDLNQKDRYLYDSTWKKVNIAAGKSYRYLRIIFDKYKPFKLGELEFYTSGENEPLTGKIIGNLPEAAFAFDGFPGMSIKLEADTSVIHWLGLDLGKNKVITKFAYLPAGDSHFIVPGKIYVLYYWENEWISAGIQKATKISLEYKKVPKERLYLLRCIDCTIKEQRPFTYENGKQIWW